LTRADRPTSPADPVLAAGVLCWRCGPDGLQVLLVRSVAHDEWSWPKGRLEPGETAAAAALRETAEETGLPVRLGVSLGSVSYRLPDGRGKQVAYWAAQVRAEDDQPRPPRAAAGEIAEAVWVPADRATGLLPHAEHHRPLAELTARAANGRLQSSPVLVLRHASARSRQAWSGNDSERPLSAKGRRQAAGLTAVLACWQPVRLVSSPWRRCLDTVAPYATGAALPVVTDPGLSEAGHRRAPQVAAGRVEELIAGGLPALICTHRPVLAAILAAVAEHGTPGVTAGLPADDPYLRPGELLVAHVVADPDGRLGGWGGRAVVAVERQRQPRI
jgi:8-oxo-(d)GTP phosphatase